MPNQIATAAEGRPMLRLRNIHPDLNGMDLSNLLNTVAPVDFVKFDPRNETIAYVCFQNNYTENNNRAILKFDGKKAMGNTLVVENATSLADRIAPAQLRQNREFSRDDRNGRERRDRRDDASASHPREQHRVRAKAKAKVERAKKIRPVKKTAEDLDSELSAYMNAASSEPAAAEPAPFAAQNNGEAMMD